ncbi:TetR/AcrR family transcriptional regulator [Nocardioides marmoriginsengisoli]|uniref:TetR/AcrR family transcriptional regulator n=1 Tax=Nocardioides marmoriginsengisoli TaxID=661483 RepID=A0A3N0CEB7_9ACTN|nr:TetR/AcrR family transcriptional regulator [Nocardioides marmoriginsengisoli]RNL61353.1 TetR/AcrR family transcriptional regulator [Nocardioides marmoriginsengisoli]
MTEVSVTSLLDAARAQFLRTGVRRTSGDDIARTAGVNRATLYRRVGTKDEIVRQTYLAETQKVLAVIEAAIGPVPEPGAAGFEPVAYVETFFTVTITQLRENPLLQQLLVIDRDETLVGLTLNAGETLTLSTALVADRIRSLRRFVGNPEVDDIDDQAVTLARLAQSLLLTPDAPPRLDTKARMHAYARTVVAPMVLGR